MNSSPARAEAPRPTAPSQKNTCPELLLHPLTPALPMSLQADAALWDFLQEREFMYRSLKDYHEKKVSLILNFISLVGFIAFKIKR